jgi:hypothetical protein
MGERGSRHRNFSILQSVETGQRNHFLIDAFFAEK